MSDRPCCALCIDNVAAFGLEVETTSLRKERFETGRVFVCWPCFDKRIDDLKHDLTSRYHDDGSVHLGAVTGFAVAIIEASNE